MEAYARMLEGLFARTRRGVVLDLDRPRRVAAALGNPQDAYPIIHIAGTNGKGSTAAMIDAILGQAGKKVGLYTSPHLRRFSERIRVAGQEISPPDLVSRLGQVERAAGADDLTFFELATLLAFLHFRHAKVDVVVAEVGLGGRLDATNLCRSPRVCVLTGVAMDHAEYLGSSLADIAREKAGIFKPGCPAVVALPEDPAACAVIQARARELAVPLGVFGRDFDDVDLPPLGLSGRHQRRNAALAREAVMQANLSVSRDAISRGLATVRWPGRLERIGDILLDCAHNVDAACQLAQSVSGRPHLVFGALADKDAASMLAQLVPVCDRIFLTTPPSSRAADPAVLARDFPFAQCERDPLSALARARRLGKEVLVTGSVYLVGHVRGYLLGEPADPMPLHDPLAVARS